MYLISVATSSVLACWHIVAHRSEYFSPPPKWQRAPKNSFNFPGLLDVWFSPTHSATTFRPNINLRFVNLAGSTASLDSIVTDSLTSMRERDPTLEVLERRDNLRCRRGASERIDLRLLATDGSSQTFEMVATRVQGGVYIAAYARSTGDAPDPAAQKSVEGLCPT
jgi:hypothetical protein